MPEQAEKPTPQSAAKTRLPNPEPEWVKETALAKIKQLEEENASLREENEQLKAKVHTPYPLPENKPRRLFGR